MPDLPSALEVARSARGQHRALVQELVRDAPLMRANISHLSTDFDEMVRAELFGEADRTVLDEILTAVNIYLGAPERDPSLERLVDSVTTSYGRLSSRADVSPVALAIAGTALDSAEAAADEAQRNNDPDRGGGGEPAGGGGGGGVGVGNTTFGADIILAVLAGKAGGLAFGPLGAALGALIGGAAGSAVVAQLTRAGAVSG